MSYPLEAASSHPLIPVWRKPSQTYSWEAAGVHPGAASHVHGRLSKRAPCLGGDSADTERGDGIILVKGIAKKGSRPADPRHFLRVQ